MQPSCWQQQGLHLTGIAGVDHDAGWKGAGGGGARFVQVSKKVRSFIANFTNLSREFYPNEGSVDVI